MSDPRQYTVGWICAIGTEYTAAQAFLDEKHQTPEPLSPADNNDYACGKIGKHHVVIAVLPDGEYGKSSAASVARDMLHSFRNVRIGLMVGIGGGAPSSKHDIRLGDLVVSAPRDGNGGIFEYDFGKTIQDQAFLTTGVLNQPPTSLRAVVTGLYSHYESEGHQFQEYIDSILEKKPRLRKKYRRPDPASDRLYRSDCIHPRDNQASCTVVCGDDPSCLIMRDERTEDEDDTTIHYGLIASADQLMKDALIRDRLAAEKGVLCFEMEAAGLVNHFPCLVIRGICDYADSHKNKEWQGYAAMVAAAYARDLLYRLAPNRVENEKSISEFLHRINTTALSTEANVATINSKLSQKEDREALEWLTQDKQGSYQSDYLRRRQPGTGQWLLESTAYKDWRSGDKQTLFCSGIPGSGKTILTTIVIEDLTAQCSSDSTLGLAYVYFNYRRKDEQKVEDLLATILKQLAFRVPESVRKLHEIHKERQTRPLLSELSRTIQSVAATYTKVLVVIDALDECQTTDDCRNVFLSELLNLQKKCGVKLFATARPIPEITERFMGYHMDIRAHESDLRKYLEGRISQAGSELLKIQEKEITDRITELADGMFLLAQLHFDSIKTKITLKQVKETLRSFPRGPEAYTQAYYDATCRIKGQDNDSSKLAMNVLMWITCAKRQLSIREVQEALAVEEDQCFLDKENVIQEKILVSVCAGLVVVDEESQAIRLVHYTTQDYFERNQDVWFCDAEFRLTTVCIKYLSYDTFESGTCPSDEEFEARLQQNPLYDYAARNWGYHASGADTNTSSLVHRFLESDAKVSASTQVLKALPSWRIDYSQQGPTMVTGLHLFAYFGVTEAAFTLAENQELWDVKDSDGRTPLSWATENGQETFVNLLLEKGADLDLRDRHDRTPLSLAAEHGHETLVKLLLAKGADLESNDKDGRTPLSWAAENGHETIVKFLLEKGADLDLRDKDSRTPLSWATENGKENLVNFLIEKGADFDPRDIHGRTPLSLATEKGHETLVNLLLEKGADFDLRDIYGRTPLSFATEHGYETLVKLLLAKGANFMSKDERDQTPLSWSGENGHQTIVKLLLEKGADLESKDKGGRTPLSWTAERGYKTVIELLLEMGANIKSKDKDGRTPLFGAVWNERETVVKLLLEKGADLDAKDERGRTSLFWAVGNGQETMVRLLLEKGANFKSKDKHDITPLAWAASNGHESIVKLLLEKDADLESKDEGGRTALFRAAQGRYEISENLFYRKSYQSGHIYRGFRPSILSREGSGRETVLKLLLEKGANYDLRDKDGFTPLSMAAKNGYKAIVNILLEKGADLESKDKFGLTPLSWAAKNGHETLVRLLLEKGADLESKDKFGQTSLFWAVDDSCETVVKLLLGKGANYDLRDEDGVTSLSVAAKNGHKAIVNMLLEKGADLESKDKFGLTPLSWAAKNGHNAIVNILLEKGAEFDSRDQYDQTPLFWAAKNGYEAIVNLLLEKDAEFDSRDQYDRTPLFVAVKNGHEAIVNLLLEKDAKSDSRDQYNQTPLFVAANNGYEAIVNLLLEKDAEFDSRDQYNQTPLSVAVRNRHEAIVNILLEKGANYNLRDKDSLTPLFWAVINRNEAIVNLLLEKDAEFDLRDQYDQTPLFVAASNGHQGVVKLLLEKGAEFDLRDQYDQTPLFWAAKNGHKDVVQLLLDEGAKFDLKDQDGKSPLFWAAENGHEAIVGLLLQKRAESDLKDQFGQTPLVLAAQSRYEAILEPPLSRGGEVDSRD